MMNETQRYEREMKKETVIQDRERNSDGEGGKKLNVDQTENFNTGSESGSYQEE